MSSEPLSSLVTLLVAAATIGTPQGGRRPGKGVQAEGPEAVCACAKRGLTVLPSAGLARGLEEHLDPGPGACLLPSSCSSKRAPLGPGEPCELPGTCAMG